jgi:excisionase family DNA binding protein
MTETEQILRVLEDLKALNSFNKNVLSLNEACLYTSISKSYMYKLTSSKKIPFYNPFGKKIYFNKDELDKWLTSEFDVNPQKNISNQLNNWAEQILKQ